MSFAPGDIAILRSGGLPMTVVSVKGDDVECVWLSEAGELFRDTIPAVALEAVVLEEDDEDEDDEDEDDED
ncbi:MAG TPA: DUF2158 domain-containing protein [Xanthobacteraceae bacterium]|nr:DUF2158 domain-containing protein [Xanthobacteraceae bacterium]